MRYRRTRITIEINCDIVPGKFHIPEDWEELARRTFIDACPWYDATVTMEECATLPTQAG